jgi:hypothetical protein
MSLLMKACIVVAAFCAADSSWAQQSPPSSPGKASLEEHTHQSSCPQMPGVEMPCRQVSHAPKLPSGTDQMTSMEMNSNPKPLTFVESIKVHATSGTSAEPNSTPVEMPMTFKRSWMRCCMANYF